MGCLEVMGHCYLIYDDDVAATIKGIHIEKAAGPTGVV